MTLTTNGRQPASPHLFCVNRSPAFLELLLELLQGERYVVTATNSHVTALAQIAVARPHLVIVDLAPGDEDALALVRDLATDPATSPIPLLLTSTDPQLIARVKAEPNLYRPEACLIKPFDLNDLLGEIATLVRPA